MNLIINCDDFGMSKAINKGVFGSYKTGTLLSTSLLITGSATEDALEVFQDCPNLGVALHVNLDELLGFGPNSYQGSSIQDIDSTRLRQIASSTDKILNIMDAQIKKALAMGFKLTHIDGHHHAHLFPGVIEQVVLVAKQYNIRRIRFFEDFYKDHPKILFQIKQLLIEEDFCYPDGFTDFSYFQSLSHLSPVNNREIMVHIADDLSTPNDWRVRQFNKLQSSQFRKDLAATEYSIANFSSL